MVCYGVDVTQTNHDKNNVVHTMVTASFLSPKCEDAMVTTYQHLSKIISRDTLQMLLIQADRDGFRPLELAASLGTFGLFMAIFETEGVYLDRQVNCGAYTLQWFDISDYDPRSTSCRHDQSPMVSFMNVDQRKLGDSKTKELFESGLFRSWLSSRMRFNRMALYLLVF